MIATNIEQSKHLQLVLDTRTADMVWRYVTSGCYRLEILHKKLFGATDKKDILAWSLSALLKVIPKEYEPDLQRSPVTGQYFMYGFFDLENPIYMTKDYDSPVDAAYEMVCYLLENNLIKKGG